MFLIVAMPIEMLLSFWVLMVVLLLSLLKVEKLVKITFWSYLLLSFSLAFWTLVLQGVHFFQSDPELTFLGLSYQKLANFFLSAQPTLMLLGYVLGLWFFAQSSHLSIRLSSELFGKRLQTLLRGFLCLGSILSSVFFSLAYFKGALYERIFEQSIIAPYTSRIPLISLLTALITLISASQLNLRFFLKKQESWIGL